MKWFIKILAAVVVIVAAVITALSFHHDNHLSWLPKPDHRYDDQVNPATPDYSKLANWAAIPSRPNSSSLVPPGFPQDVDAPLTADVFYVHPTSFVSGEAWNDDLAFDTLAEDHIQAMLATQASAFNACCKIYAPRYRQATLFSFFNESGDSGTQALDLAYRDVLAAFDYYMAIYNEGRPIVLASHSQGTAHLVRLLADRFNQGPRRDQLVVVYAIGYYLPGDYLQQVVPGLTLCKTGDDIGCIIHWDAYSSNNSARVNDFPLWYSTGWSRAAHSQPICVNPLSWNDDQAVSALVAEPGFSLSDYLANRAASGDLQLIDYIAEYAAANCVEGRLEVHIGDDLFSGWMGPDGSLHAYDFALFWGQIRANVKNRVATFNLTR